jgi:hypothetical protein
LLNYGGVYRILRKEIHPYDACANEYSNTPDSKALFIMSGKSNFTRKHPWISTYQDKKIKENRDNSLSL